jgi:uncharacterized protein (TIGR00299 family) protein
MKRIAYFDCFAGVSGDMILGALLDAGLKLKDLREMLGCLHLKGYKLGARRVKRGGLSGTKITIRLTPGAGRKLRGPGDILALIHRSGLSLEVKRAASRVFQELATAEERVHRMKAAEVHFHELGAVDTVIDVVGSITGLFLLGVEEVYSSPLPWNSGSVECAHGTLPLPSPAVTELMKGIKVYPHRVVGEMVTPTGAAILKSCAKRIGYMPAMVVRRVGYGAGEKHFKNWPNLLRLVLGESCETGGGERVTVMETEIDDMSPTHYDYLARKLFERGALDVFMTAVLMKKNRPGHLLTVLCEPALKSPLAELILEESTTLGIRFREEERTILPRVPISVRTRYGTVRVKLAKRPHGEITISPEYDDCAEIASKKNVPLRSVMTSAMCAAEIKIKKRPYKF